MFIVMAHFTRRFIPFLVIFSALMTSTASASELYKTMLVRAAPGRLAELIQLYKDRMPLYKEEGDAPPFWMRHTQGDQWDLLFLYPMGSFPEYFSPERVKRRQQAQQSAGFDQEDFATRFYELVAWHEEVFVTGPAPTEVTGAFEGSKFFHVEMFHALPGKNRELYRQREMENAYLRELSRPQNLIFVHSQGASWDLFTIGFYRDLKHFSESADIPAEKEQAAARTAGFKSASDIGLYLRGLIQSHNDTLAVAIQ
jgi:hypothetical protein